MLLGGSGAVASSELPPVSIVHACSQDSRNTFYSQPPYQLCQGCCQPHPFLCCSAAGGVHASDFVTELHSQAELDKFVGQQDDSVLTVINVSVGNAAPCIHIFPAVLALARSFKGFAAFGRWGVRCGTCCTSVFMYLQLQCSAVRLAAALHFG